MSHTGSVYSEEVVRALQEENKKLKEQLEEKEEEVSLINSEEMENEEKIAKLEEENKELKGENKKLKGKATAWDIINNGSDWENLRDLCDEEMCKGLIETGECDEEDFEGWSCDPE